MTLITRPEGLSADQIAPSRRSLGVATAGGLMFAAGLITLAAPWLMQVPALHEALAALGCLPRG